MKYFLPIPPTDNLGVTLLISYWITECLIPLMAVYPGFHGKLKSKYSTIKLANGSGSCQCSAFTSWHIWSAIYCIFYELNRPLKIGIVCISSWKIHLGYPYMHNICVVIIETGPPGFSVDPLFFSNVCASYK